MCYRSFIKYLTMSVSHILQPRQPTPTIRRMKKIKPLAIAPAFLLGFGLMTAGQATAQIIL